VTPGPPPDLAAAAGRVRDDAVTTLSDLAGGAGLCAISRSGTPFPAGKYHEGRMAVAAIVLRALRDTTDPGAALRTATERWAALSPPERRSAADWEAYGAGGDDVLAELDTVLGSGGR
jgi:hypothetical protein